MVTRSRSRSRCEWRRFTDRAVLRPYRLAAAVENDHLCASVPALMADAERSMRQLIGHGVPHSEALLTSSQSSMMLWQNACWRPYWSGIVGSCALLTSAARQRCMR